MVRSVLRGIYRLSVIIIFTLVILLLPGILLQAIDEYFPFLAGRQYAVCFLLIFFMLYISQLLPINLRRGKVTAEGLLRVFPRRVFRWNRVGGLTGSIYRGVTLLPDVDFGLATPEGEKQVSLARCEMVSLVRTAFNQWQISRSTITVKQGERLNIAYTHCGKYNFWYVDSVFWAVSFMALFTTLIAPVWWLWFAGLAVAAFGSYLFVREYKKMSVTLTENDITVNDEHSAERILPLADVAKVERGFFRTRVTAKNGVVLHFPRACYLLPEMIEEFAGLR